MRFILAQADADGASHTFQTPRGDASEREEHEKGTAILICTHAACLIAIARVLTGHMPSDIYDHDFKTFTCGISKFQRRKTSPTKNQASAHRDVEVPVSHSEWRNGRGVAGGWDCVVNSNCAHLAGGEERGWSVYSIFPTPYFGCDVT